jgi:hypothetical protein
MATTGHETEVITVEGLKASLQKYKDKGRFVHQMNSAPTSSTTTYTIGTGASAKTYNFKVGDEVRVYDASEGTTESHDYVYYKLYDLVTEGNTTTAYWDLVGAGAGGGASYTPTLNAAPTSSTTTYTKDGKTKNFEVGQFCRVANSQSNTGYDFYQLYDLTTSGDVTTATWKSTTLQPTYDASTHTAIFPSGSGVTVENHTVVFS